jgi:hypothetical protein
MRLFNNARKSRRTYGEPLSVWNDGVCFDPSSWNRFFQRPNRQLVRHSFIDRPPDNPPREFILPHRQVTPRPVSQWQIGDVSYNDLSRRRWLIGSFLS